MPTPDEVRAQLRRVNMLDQLLTPEEREQLRNDLAEMAKQRRDAEASAAQWVLP